MHVWGSNGQWLVHVFHINNELAGYCSVKHGTQLRGMTGHYGPNPKAVVIGFGSVEEVLFMAQKEWDTPILHY